jgi:hypothetical protein
VLQYTFFGFRICQQPQEKPMEKVGEETTGMSEQEVIFLSLQKLFNNS